MICSTLPEWFSTKMLAKAKLGGLPPKQGGISSYAKRNDWQDKLRFDGLPLCKKRDGDDKQGGGYLYRIEVLTEAQQEQLRLHYATLQAEDQPVVVAKAPASVQERLDEFARLSSKKKAEARRRLVALNLFEDCRRLMTVREAIAKVAVEVGASPTTVQNWRNLVKPVILQTQYWEAFLAPRHRGKAGINAECHPEAFEYYKSSYLTLTKRSYQACYHFTKKVADDLGWQLASPAAMSARLKREVPFAVKILLREGIDALRRIIPAQERDRSMFHALEGVQGDGHKMDMWVKFPDGEVVRPMVVMFSDILTNKFLGWHIAKSENTVAVRLAFRQVLVKYGIPDWLLLDNGRAFASKEFTGGQKTRFRNKIKDGELAGVLTSLSIKVHWATPGHGQSKPIERSFQDVCNYIAKDPRFEGAYTGNSPVNKPAFSHDPRDKAASFDLFKAIFEEGIADINARIGRRSPVHNGLSYDQVFEASYTSVPIRKASEEQLRLVLMKAEQVTARKETGAVFLRDNRFWSEFLNEHIGEKLTLRFDPDDIHAGVDVYDHDGRYLGNAECIDKVGFHSETAVKERRADEVKLTKATKVIANIERKYSPSEQAKMLPNIDRDEDPALEPAAVRLFVPQRGNMALNIDDDFDDEDEDDLENSALMKLGDFAARVLKQRRI